MNAFAKIAFQFIMLLSRNISLKNFSVSSAMHDCFEHLGLTKAKAEQYSLVTQSHFVSSIAKISILKSVTLLTQT